MGLHRSMLSHSFVLYSAVHVLQCSAPIADYLIVLSQLGQLVNSAVQETSLFFRIEAVLTCKGVMPARV